MTAPGTAERALAARTISALLRENYGGLATRARLGAGGGTLRLPAAGRLDLTLPLEPDGFLADFRVPADADLTLDDVRSAVAVLAGTRDAAGAAAFDAECRQALAEASVRAQHACAPGTGTPATGTPGAGVRGDDASGTGTSGTGTSGTGTGGAGVRGWLGAAGQSRFDALAAALPHPAYPASPCRMGLRAEDLTAYAPEFGPEFELYWAAVPKEAVVQAGACQDDEWWPDPETVGLPAGLAMTHALFPVHPLAAQALPAKLPGSPVRVILAPRRYLRVRPTLSLRTVAVTDHPAAHLKLPLPVSTLGMRNTRSIAPATLADGALVYRLLGLVREQDADPSLAGLLLADDTGYAQAGDRMAGYLLRRLPAGLDGCHVVPVAALTAAVPGGRTVLEELAGPDGVLALAETYFRLVFGIAVRLLVRYGVALESHQQNAAVVFSPVQPPRLLVKDFDGALLHAERLRSALGAHAPSTGAPAAGDFADQRLLTSSDDALIDVFITITVHLCVGAICFSLAEHGAAPLPVLLRTARRALEDAITAESEAGGSPEAIALLRARVLRADRLTGKSMVTAGTLTAKEYTGAADINKYYGTTGPNYLLETR